MPDCPTYPSITELDRRLSLTTDPVAIERIERTKAIVRRLGAERQSERRSRRMERKPDQIARTRALLHPDGLKTCHHCGRGLPFSAFPVRPSRRDGLHAWCTDCFGSRTAQQKEPTE